MFSTTRPQPYAPTPYSYTPTSALSATIPLDEQATLHTSASARDTYESLAELYSIIVTLDAIEKAYIKDSIPETLYADTCARLLKQYRSNLSDERVARAFGDLDAFCRDWALECPRAVERIRIGLPAAPTAPQPTEGGGSGGGGAATALVVAASENFITLLDAIRIGMVSKDQLHPLLVETIQAVNKVTGAEFEGKEKIVHWLITLNQMRAAEELGPDQQRDLQFDMETAYFGFKVLDLPQLYQKPSFAALNSALALLSVAPPSFSTSTSSSAPHAPKPTVHPTGVTNYLTSIVASPLSWLSSDTERETLWNLASERLAERAGRTAMGDITRSFEISLGPTSSSPPKSTSDPSAPNHARTSPSDTNPRPQKALTLHLHEPSLTSDNLGLKTWSSSYLVANLLHKILLPLPSNPEDNLPTTTTLPSPTTPTTASPPQPPLTLELGSGTGLLGLTAAALLPTHTTLLTDLPAIVPNLARNAAAAGLGLRVRCGVLDWAEPRRVELVHGEGEGEGEGEGMGNVEFKPGTASLVLAADPIYSPAHPGLLAGAVKVWLARPPLPSPSLPPSRHSSPSAIDTHPTTTPTTTSSDRSSSIAPKPTFILAHPHRAAYAPQIAELRARLADEVGLRVAAEGVERGWDDWDEGVEVAWSVWVWEDG